MNYSKMLQRQIISKQLQELQRRQQLQELGNDNRNQNYAHQISLAKQAAGVQFPLAVNEMAVQDSSRMFTAGNMKMMQQNGPNGLFLSQNHNLAPDFDVSSHRIHAPIAGEKLNDYSHLQGLANQNQAPVENSFSGQRYNFPSQQINVGDGLLLSDQEDNSFGQAGCFDRGILSGNYIQQGFTVQKSASILESEKGGENACSLDPLEQKILYNTDDFNWESTFGRNREMSSRGFDRKVEMPFMQSGSWSALMQSAVAVSSSSDTGVEEEWSGLSFQNPEPLNEGEKLQNDWVDRNLQNGSSPSSKLHDMVQNIDSFSNFQSAQYLKPKEEYQPTRGSKLVQESLASPNIWSGKHTELSNNDAHQNSNFSCTNENHPHNNLSGRVHTGDFGPQGITSDYVSGIQTNYTQVNNMNSRGYSVKPENMASDGVCSGENVIASRESVFEHLNMDDTSIDQTSATQLNAKVSNLRNLPDAGFRLGPTDHQLPHLYSSFSLPSMGISSATPPLNDITMDYIKYQHSAPLLQSQMATEFPVQSASVSHENSETKISNSSGSEDPVLLNRNEGFPPSLWPENHCSFPHEYQQLKNENSVFEGSTEIINTKLQSRRAQEQDLMRKHHSNSANSGSLITNPCDQASNEAEIKMETPSFPARDIGPFRHSLNQNHSPSHQMLSTRNDETDEVRNFPPKYANIKNDHFIGNARNLLLRALQHKDSAKRDLYSASWLGVWSGKTSMLHNQNYAQQADIFCQNLPTSMNDTPSLVYQSHISSETAPSWLKNYERLKNGQILPMYDAASQNNPAKQMGPGNSRENSLIMQVDFVNTKQSVTTMATNKSSSACVLPTFQTLGLSMPKKRKFFELDMVPWHEEVNRGPSRLQDISTAECIWAQASNRKPEEASNATVNVEEFLPVVRAKKRLICTTQHMQQIFQPIPVIILCSDASLTCDSVAYVAARLELGDAWFLTGQLASNTNNMSPYKLKTSNEKEACEFSELVKAFIDRIKKVEADLSRVDKSLSFVDFKVEVSEMERFSTNNRFARFHTMRAQPAPNNALPSHTATLFNPGLQKYVIPRAMPEIVPEGQNCISL
ncbi:hypothetical protein STAS_06665 [Striga asiatica]|uniref:Dentin sialophospho protein n=1 Tax=Striga asiatica TaxID=4170 RepID=A0A5A7PDW6_STRAF|nr:hypothetical protein STAS_06665 [Striga asiatica]